MEAHGQDETMLLRPMETAKILAVGRSTIYGMIAKGELPVCRVGLGGRAVRIPRSGLNEWIRLNTEQALDSGEPKQ